MHSHTIVFLVLTALLLLRPSASNPEQHEQQVVCRVDDRNLMHTDAKTSRHIIGSLSHMNATHAWVTRAAYLRLSDALEKANIICYTPLAGIASRAARARAHAWSLRAPRWLCLLMRPWIWTAERIADAIYQVGSRLESPVYDRMAEYILDALEPSGSSLERTFVPFALMMLRRLMSCLCGGCIYALLIDPFLKFGIWLTLCWTGVSVFMTCVNSTSSFMGEAATAARDLAVFAALMVFVMLPRTRGSVLQLLSTGMASLRYVHQHYRDAAETAAVLPPDDPDQEWDGFYTSDASEDPSWHPHNPLSAIDDRRDDPKDDGRSEQGRIRTPPPLAAPSPSCRVPDVDTAANSVDSGMSSASNVPRRCSQRIREKRLAVSRGCV